MLVFHDLSQFTQWLIYAFSTVHFIFRKWNTEPNNYNGAEDCATISQTGEFNDVPCLSRNGFICELQTEGLKYNITFVKESFI